MPMLIPLVPATCDDLPTSRAIRKKDQKQVESTYRDLMFSFMIRLQSAHSGRIWYPSLGLQTRSRSKKKVKRSRICDCRPEKRNKSIDSVHDVTGRYMQASNRWTYAWWWCVRWVRQDSDDEIRTTRWRVSDIGKTYTASIVLLHSLSTSPSCLPQFT